VVSYCSKTEYADIGQVLTLLEGSDKKKLDVLLKSCYMDEAPAHEFAVVLQKNDDPVPHLCKVACLKNCETDGSVILVAFENIGNRIQWEKSLQKAKKRAEIQEELKSSFLVNMSHEIRTPMNSIIGFAELIQNSDNEEEKREYIEIIRSSGQFLLNIINDIIDISKLKSGVVNIKVNRVRLNDLIRELCKIYASDERLRKGVEVKYKLPLDDEHAIVLSDSTRLRQILSNLLDNAVKFTNEGTITIGYEVLDSPDTNKSNFIRFYVVDTGIGIPLSEQNMIFTKYHQVKNIDESMGTGLGLAIVEALVSKLGGKMLLKSELGKGSEFSFKLPCLWRSGEHKSEIKPIDKIANPNFANHHILIAEDAEINYLFLINLLKKSNVKTSWAKNGKDAVEFVLEDPSVDLVLMDMKMPIMDGYKASSHIKSFNPKLPIIAVTAYAMDGDMEKAIVAGCDDYLSKPVDIHELFKKLDYFLNR
jgi:CheY-like chemotaxis protein